MQPSDGFWDGVGTGLGESPWWAIVALLLVVIVLVFVAKAWLPEWRQDRSDRRKIEARRVELEAKAQEDSDVQARDRIKLTERQLDIQNDQTRALENLTAQTQLLNAKLEASQKRSSHMGDVVDSMDGKIDHMSERVDELHEIVSHKLGGTD